MHSVQTEPRGECANAGESFNPLCTRKQRVPVLLPLSLCSFASGKVNKMPKPTKKSPKPSLSNGTNSTFRVLAVFRALALPGDSLCPCNAWDARGDFAEMWRGHCTSKAFVSQTAQSPKPLYHQTKWHRGYHRNPGQAKLVHFRLHSQGTTGDSDGMSPPPAQGSEPQPPLVHPNTLLGCPVTTSVPAYPADLGHQPHGLLKHRCLTAMGMRENA